MPLAELLFARAFYAAARRAAMATLTGAQPICRHLGGAVDVHPGYHLSFQNLASGVAPVARATWSRQRGAPSGMIRGEARFSAERAAATA